MFLPSELEDCVANFMRLFHLLISLLCVTGSIVLMIFWIRGHYVLDECLLGFGQQRPNIRVISGDGVLSFFFRSEGSPLGVRFKLAVRPVRNVRSLVYKNGDPEYSFLGFEYIHARYWGRPRIISIPNWFIMILIQTPTLISLFRCLKRVRQQSREKSFLFTVLPPSVTQADSPAGRGALDSKAGHGRGSRMS